MYIYLVYINILWNVYISITRSQLDHIVMAVCPFQCKALCCIYIYIYPECYMLLKWEYYTVAPATLPACHCRRTTRAMRV